MANTELQTHQPASVILSQRALTNRSSRRAPVAQAYPNQPRELAGTYTGRSLWPQVGSVVQNRNQTSSLLEVNRTSIQDRSCFTLPPIQTVASTSSNSMVDFNQLVEQADKQETTPKALLAALSNCPAVARRVIVAVNSGRFGLSAPVSSLLQAHVALGQNTFRQLILDTVSLAGTPQVAQ
jgi:hypothetical protein